MKKIIYLLSLVTVFILGSCSDDLPKASWDICQVGTLKKYHPALQEANAGN